MHYDAYPPQTMDTFLVAAKCPELLLVVVLHLVQRRVELWAFLGLCEVVAKGRNVLGTIAEENNVERVGLVKKLLENVLDIAAW